MISKEFSEHNHLLKSSSQSSSNVDIEQQQLLQPRPPPVVISSSPKGKSGIRELFKHFDRSFSPRRLSKSNNSGNNNNSGGNGSKNNSRANASSSSSSNSHGVDHSNPHYYTNDDEEDADFLAESAPPEWALLLVGCLLGLATGLCVAVFNRGVHIIHEWGWAGTPTEGAAWLRLQRLADTWHRILLIPVTGGVIVGMMHGLLEILEQIRQSSSSSPQGQGFDLLSGVFPAVKAIQAAVTLGTGCSLGPEGPSVDIGKSCAQGCSLMMENNRERKIALVAAGAAAGIASGFNAAVAGCFFAIETVLRPLRAENSPPFTTAMIILASVISSTVSNVLLGEKPAFTVPTYELKSAAELPLYLILGMLCGVVSVAFTRLVNWCTELFEFIKKRFGLPPVVCPAIGGLGAGLIAMKYPGILYWGFTNVEEILHTGKTASAPGIWLLAQLAAAKVVATALCKGSGLVGGLYAPSLMIGAAVGAVFGGIAAELINSAIPGNAAVAQPQAYALVGMAATLASVCSVPLTSVLLLFELTKDYRILLPLMGAVGLAIWVPSVTNQHKEAEVSEGRSLARGYSFLLPTGDKHNGIWRQSDVGANGLELSTIGSSIEHMHEDVLLEDLKVSQAMSRYYVKVSLTSTLKEAMKYMDDNQQNCAFVVDPEELLEGILTRGDVRRYHSMKSNDGSTAFSDVETSLVSSVCTRGISYRGRKRGLLTCYPDTDLDIAKELMEAKGIKQLPVVMRSRESQRRRKNKIVAILQYESVWKCLREEADNHKSVFQQRTEGNLEVMVSDVR